MKRYGIIVFEILFQGEELCRAIYREPWLEIDPQLVPLMNMIAVDSQQTFLIKVGPFMVLTYEFFLQLLGAVITYLLIIVQFKD